MELSILYFKGSVIGLIFYKMMYFTHEDLFFFANSAEPDEMPHYPLMRQLQQKSSAFLAC